MKTMDLMTINDDIKVKEPNSTDSLCHQVHFFTSNFCSKNNLSDQSSCLKECHRTQNLLHTLLQHWDVFDYKKEIIPSEPTETQTIGLYYFIDSLT